MNARFWPLATIVLGLATLAIVLSFSALSEVKAAYPAGDFAIQLGYFQRAVAPTDLAAVFGAPADPAKLTAMTAGNRLDLYAFIPVYTLFLIAGASMLAGGLRAPLVWLSIIPTLIGAGADVIETSKQIAMTLDYANADALLPLAPWCWAKYFSLALGALGASAMCFRSKRWILGALGVLPLIATLADWSGAVDVPTLMTLGFGGFWIALIVVGVMELLRKQQV